MKRAFLAGMGLLALAGIAPVRAADMPLKAPPPPLFIERWTGFYLGANVGFGLGNKKLYDLFPTPDFDLDADTAIRGWLGGYQLGYNYQIKSLVFGVESNFDWSGVKSNFGCFTFGNQQCTVNAEWFATIVGRVGGVFGSALLYVDGGAAWTRDTLTDVATVAGSRGGVPSLPGDEFSGSQIRPGWTVGAGIEYLLSHNWSAKVEYDYLNFGERRITLADGLGNVFPEEMKQTVQLMKVGFNYRFNGAGVTAPVMSYAAEPNVNLGEDSSGKTIRGFSILDVGKDSFDGLVGGLVALSKDLDTSGPRLWIVGGAGWYQFGTTNGPIRGIYSTGDLLGGYGFEGNTYEINLLAGVSAENDMLSGIDQTDAVKGTAGGFKVRGDLWSNPTPQTLIYGEAEYSTAFQTYYTSAKYGFDITNGKQIFVGPEVVAFGDARFDQWRLGAHMTQMKVGKVQVDISGGYAHDSVVGDGAYSHVEFSTEF